MRLLDWQLIQTVRRRVLSYASIFESLWNQTELYEHIRYLYEQLKSHDKMKQEFMDIAAHELRTPIQPILGLAQILKDQITDSAQTKFLDIMFEECKAIGTAARVYASCDKN